MSIESRLHSSLSRRELVKKAGKGFIAATYIGAAERALRIAAQAHSEDGIRVMPAANNDYSFLEDTKYPAKEAEFLDLSQKFEMTIAHRAGNTKDGIIAAAHARFTHVDLDIEKINDELCANHEKSHMFAGITILSTNKTEGKIRILHDPPTLRSLFHEAGMRKIGVSAELNHGNFKEKDIEELLKLQREYAIPLMVHSKNEHLVELGKSVGNGSPVRWLTVPSADRNSWKSAIRNSEGRNDSGILTNQHSANDYSNGLKDVYVVIGDVDTKDAAIEATKLTSVKGVMGELSKLARLITA